MDALSQIISSLTPTEKRYFSMFARAFKSETELIKLFDVLDSKPECTTGEIKHTTGIKNLTVAKSNLKKLLLKAMRNFMEESNPDIQLRDLMSNIDFLMRKGLFGEARKEIHKGWKLAERSGNYSYSPRMLYRMVDITHRTLKPDALVKDFNLQLQLLDSLIYKQHQIFISSFYNQHITHLMRHNTQGNSNVHFDKVIREIKNRVNAPAPPYATLVNLINLAACYQAVNNKREAVNTYEKIWGVFKNNPRLIDTNPNGYFTYLSNYGIIAAAYPGLEKKALKLFAQMDAGFAKYKSFFASSPDRIIYYKERLTTNRISFAKTYSRWSMLNVLEQEVYNHIKGKGNKEKIVKALQSAMLTSCFYQQGNYDKAIEWARIYYTLDDAKVLKPMMMAARVMEALAFCHKQQFDVSANLCMNIYKTMLEQKLKSSYHKHLGAMLRRLNQWNLSVPGDRREATELMQHFANLNKNQDDDYIVYSTFFEPEKILNGLLNSK